MSSSHEPVYWDSTSASLAATTSYRVNLPAGTTDWAVVNASGGDVRIAGTEATITSVATPPPQLTVRTGSVHIGKGHGLFIANGTGGALIVGLTWSRVGRQPSVDAGTVTFTAL